MKRKFAAAAGVAIVATLALAGCSGGEGESSEPTESAGPVTLSLSGWSLDTTPEFQALADRYPRQERAYGFLLAMQLTDDEVE